jgi:hypothetical protein
MPLPSIAKDFFDQIRSDPDPIAFINGLINASPPTYETDWLDFKQQPRPILKDPKWREMWVEALGGFANNQGGVIIWGIDARKDPSNNIDAACGARPVDNPAGLKSRLTELQRQATDPPLANVEIEAYELPSAPGTGFVVCFVPEGPFKPYRSEDGRKSQYHVRSGDNFTVLSRSMLSTLFYPRSRAVFHLEAVLSFKLEYRGRGPGRGTKVTLAISTTNKGTATARDILFQMERGFMEGVAIRSMGPGWERDGTGMFRKLTPMHPRMPLSEVFLCDWEVPGDLPTNPPQEVSFTIYAENQEPQRFKHNFSMNELYLNERVYGQLSPLVE